MAGRGEYARHHHCARAVSVAGVSAGFWTVGEPAAASTAFRAFRPSAGAGQPSYRQLSTSIRRSYRRSRGRRSGEPFGCTAHEFPLCGRHRAGRIVEPSRGLEPEVLAQAALFTVAGGAWSPAVAATGRAVCGGRGLSEGRAGKQRDQRVGLNQKSSPKRRYSP